jgi:peroxiredoxin
MLTMSATDPKGYTVGDVASNFSLKSVKGQTVSMSDYADAKGLIVVFTCNHCPFAQLYEQRIIDLHNQFAPQGFPVVAINSNSPLIVPEDSYEEMQALAVAKQYPFEYLFDEDQTVYPVFGATRTPQVFILDANRVVRYIGAIDNNPESPNASTQRWAQNAVKALLKGERPNPEFTRAAGCTIKKAPPPPAQPSPAPEISRNDIP